MIPVIIPIYKKPEQVARCIQHLERQTVKVEVFLRDNNQENLFFTAAINEGIRKYLDADCSYLILLNQDMYLEPDAVGHMIRFMDAHPRCGIGTPLQEVPNHADHWVVAGGLKAFPFGVQRVGPLSQFTEDEQIHWANGACMVLRKSMIREIGLLDENFIFIGSDSDYCLTARSRGWEVWRIAAARGVHEHGQSGSSVNMRLELLKVNDMLYFGRKWIDGGLYRQIAADGAECSPEDVRKSIDELEQMRQKLLVMSPRAGDTP